MPEHPNSTKQGYVLEHRLVMEKKIDRYLTSKEVIHHINEDKQNNSEDNLMLFSNYGEHGKYHWSLKNGGDINGSKESK